MVKLALRYGVLAAGVAAVLGAALHG